MARLIEKIVGHKNQYQFLIHAIKQNHLAHALLFVGPSGIGKKSFALALAQYLICEKNEEQDIACGQCGSCLRVESKKNENLFLLEPEKSPIKIEDSREVIDFLSLRSLGKNRVIIIDQSHWLNGQSANALLKIIEEPPQNTYFFLIAPSESLVLATIRSRTQIVRFYPIKEQDMKKVNSAPDWQIKASQGSFEKLEAIAGDSEFRNWSSYWLERVTDSPQAYLKADFKDYIKDRSHALSVAQNWQNLLRDSVYYSFDETEKLINVDQIECIKKMSQIRTSSLMEIANKALVLESAIMQSRDVQLVFEEFWIESHRELTRG